MTTTRPTHLKTLEAESIHVFREVAAQAARPVVLYSIGKDSSVLLHLARKAFYPARVPFPLLHIDTTWKFRDMIAFRDTIAKRYEFDLSVHTNEDLEAVAAALNTRPRKSLDWRTPAEALDEVLRSFRPSVATTT